MIENLEPCKQHGTCGRQATAPDLSRGIHWKFHGDSMESAWTRPRGEIPDMSASSPCKCAGHLCRGRQHMGTVCILLSLTWETMEDYTRK